MNKKTTGIADSLAAAGALIAICAALAVVAENPPEPASAAARPASVYHEPSLPQGQVIPGDPDGANR
jgi:hypothetical protein